MTVIGLTNELVTFEKQQDKTDPRLHAGHRISFTPLFSNLHTNYFYYVSVYRLRGQGFVLELPTDECSNDHGKGLIVLQNRRTAGDHIVA
jgi:hypothetical protein